MSGRFVADFRPAATIAVSSFASRSSKESLDSDISLPSRIISSQYKLSSASSSTVPSLAANSVRDLDMQLDSLHRPMSRFARAGLRSRARQEYAVAHQSISKRAKRRLWYGAEGHACPRGNIFNLTSHIL